MGESAAKSLGAFGMSTKNWDRVPIDAQSIDAPLSRAAVFLVVTVVSELTALTKVCLALDGLDDLVYARDATSHNFADFCLRNAGATQLCNQKCLH